MAKRRKTKDNPTGGLGRLVKISLPLNMEVI